MNKKNKNSLKPYLYSTPSLVLIGIVVVFPILYTLYISFSNMNIYHWFDFSFIGFENYKDALFVMESEFLAALLRTILWTVINMVLQLVIAFGLASLLNSKHLRLKSLYKTILMFPWAMPGYVSILLWRTGMFNAQFGLFNQWLGSLGLNMVNWLGDNVSAFICCSIVNMWLALPFMIMIIDGALQSIDKSYFECATISGANRLQKTTMVTIPMIKPVIGPAVVITIFTTFKQFDIIFLMTQQAGAKTGADIHTILTYAYENAFITNNYGYSSAISMIIFMMLILFTLLVRGRLKERNDE